MAVAFLMPQVDLQAVGERHKVTRSNGILRCWIRTSWPSLCGISEASGYLVVERSGVGAVEFMIRSQDIGEVCVPLTPYSLGSVTLLEQVPSITCRGSQRSWDKLPIAEENKKPAKPQHRG